MLHAFGGFRSSDDPPPDTRCLIEYCTAATGPTHSLAAIANEARPRCENLNST